MKAATINEIRQELAALKPAELLQLCLRLGRFKKENKELLTYLLFEAQDEEAFAASVIQEIDLLFSEMNVSHLYFAKKTLRKITRVINKFSRYSGEKETELKLRLHFCKSLKQSGIPLARNAMIHNIYLAQLKKVRLLIPQLHEDLQYDFNKELENLTN